MPEPGGSKVERRLPIWGCAHQPRTPSDLTQDAEAKLMASSKKRGFKNIAEYETVAANISMVVAAIDPRMREFTDPHSAIKNEIDGVAADKTITASQKKELLRSKPVAGCNSKSILGIHRSQR
jgi:hypothetical protein